MTCPEVADNFFPLTNRTDTDMLEVIEKLLILQDRDRKILRLQEELSRVGPERENLKARASSSQQQLDSAKLRVKQIESDRKKLELDAEAKRQQIEKYSLQQFQTKKNEEYRALAHEIETCKGVITRLEDQQLELMEQAEGALREAAAATAASNDANKLVEGKISELNAAEKNFKQQLETLQANRDQLADVVEESVRGRYDRLLKSKGASAVVGINHGVCGGCHMKLSRQVVVQTQGNQELVHCTNCGRILFFTTDMDMAVAD